MENSEVESTLGQGCNDPRVLDQSGKTLCQDGPLQQDPLWVLMESSTEAGTSYLLP